MPSKQVVESELEEQDTEKCEDFSHATEKLVQHPTERQIISILREKGAMTRPEMTKFLQIPRSTLYDALMRLKQRGIIRTFKFRVKDKGRPAQSSL